MSGYEERTPHRLSLREKKRIAIATVLSMQPAVLALDEPTTSLAPAARRALLELLARLPQTLVTATHDLGMVRDLDPRVVALDGGRVVADGPAVEILENGELLRAHGLEPVAAPVAGAS